jgi:4-hydroxybenzoate polyprenyltransferase
LKEIQTDQKERSSILFTPVSLLTITRPLNVLITAISVGVGGYIASFTWFDFAPDLGLAALSAALIAAGGNVFNDYCDRELDKIQKSHRPIPAGKISELAALIWSGLLSITGLLIAFFITGAAILIASWALVLLLFYSWKLKAKPLIGNVSVAFIAALAFVYGGVAVRSIGPAIWAGTMALLFHLAREIIKDVEDRAGDAEAGACTFVVRFGLKAGRFAASFVCLLLICVLPLPHLMGSFRLPYLYMVLMGVLPVVIIAVILTWKWEVPEKLHRLNVLLKVDMLVGLTALIVGRPVV